MGGQWSQGEIQGANTNEKDIRTNHKGSSHIKEKARPNTKGEEEGPNTKERYGHNQKEEDNRQDHEHDDNVLEGQQAQPQGQGA